MSNDLEQQHTDAADAEEAFDVDAVPVRTGQWQEVEADVELFPPVFWRVVRRVAKIAVAVVAAAGVVWMVLG